MQCLSKALKSLYSQFGCTPLRRTRMNGFSHFAAVFAIRNALEPDGHASGP